MSSIVSEPPAGPASQVPSELEGIRRNPVLNPPLTGAQFARLCAYGRPQEVEVGDEPFRAGDPTYDLVVVERGIVALVRPATHDAPEQVVLREGPGCFIGELNLLTGAGVILTARVEEAGRIHRVSPARLRQLMAEDAELSDILLRAFVARRGRLRGTTASRTLSILGTGVSAGTLALRTYAARLQLPHRWLDADTPDGRALMRAEGLAPADLPAIVTPARTLRGATPGDLADHLGLTYRRSEDTPVDLAVVGAGPAGLAAAVYGASEGLATVVLDAVGPGGQAAASARIENYLGFPSGLSGGELTERASIQALKFGAQISSPCRIAALDATGAQLRLRIEDGTEVVARAVVVATGARYRALPLDRWDDLLGAGIFYAATELEVRLCAGHPVTVVGGANSAGQAALFLASRGCSVTLAVRGADLRAKMSSYLVDRLLATPSVTVRPRTEVVGLRGGGTLTHVVLRDGARTAEQECRGLFCFIGATPATEWLSGVATDDAGFLRTDVALTAGELGSTWAALGRAPLPFETSIPGVFAVGDVRHGSMKRVAAAVGEGASAVRSVHAAVGMRL